MSSSRRKKAAIPTSNKKKGTSSSSGPTAKVRHPFLRIPIGPQEELFQILWVRPLIAGRCINWAAIEQVQLANAIRALLTTDPWEIFFGIIELTIPKFGTALGLYTEEFKEENDLHALNRHIHRSPSRCWDTLVPSEATYNPSRFKASALPPSLRKAREHWRRQHSRCLIFMVYVARARHQPFLFHRPRDSTPDERHRKEVISIGLYVTRLARHFGLLSTAAQEQSVTLIGQMSPQGISSMLSMRMIEKH
ncbi:hypothetical protein GOBAR_AA13453 [Gossypium barbadense]|uniref:Uncharacterized protein n=1 Tax=Gossypium barbadense TaxID=3634 RepID=A0A2P5XV28_GOSBA|nr:hypothetical protein GOBAR_AA13453 [Gossypium barbadense]